MTLRTTIDPDDGLTIVYCVDLRSKVRIWSNWMSTLMTVYFQHKLIVQLVGDDSGNGSKAGFLI